MCVTLFLAAARHTARAAHRHSSLRWLVHLGGAGLFGLAVIDSSMIPLPLPGSTDLVLLLLIAHRSNPLLMAALAIAGSILGGYLAWSTGKKGGELVLNKFVPHRLIQPVSHWVQRRGGLSVGLAALLPPPVPLTPVLLAAGTLGISRNRFLTALAIARTIRYGLLAWLAATYGRKILRAWTEYLSGWSQVLLAIYLVLLAVGLAYGFWKYRQSRHSLQEQERQQEVPPVAL